MTGLSTKTRRAVTARDRGMCLRCGQRGSDVQHRIGRGMGGSTRPEVNECLAALVTMCRRCHIWATEHPIEAEDQGWVIWRSTREPAHSIPMEDLWGRLFRLTDDGGVVPPSHEF